MKALCWFLAWEWINIVIEYTATAWMRLPRWFLAVLAVNLATHPVFTLALDLFGRSIPFILACEAAIFLAEALMLMAVYGLCRWRLLFTASLLMNATSYITGLMLMMT